MKEPFHSYSIRSEWKGRVDTPATIGAKFVKTLDALSSVDPIFANWVIADIRNSSSLSLDDARPRIASLIEDGVVRDDFKLPAPRFGYHARALAGQDGDPRSATFWLDAGGKDDGRTELEFANLNVPPDLAVVTYPRFKAALLAINAIWRAPWACAQAFRTGTVKVPIDLGGVPAFRIDGVTPVPLDPTFPYSIFHIPWIGYLAPALASGLKLTPEILTERTPDGGLLMSATTERLDPDNPQHARRARILTEAMIACTG
ncbi:MAG TPA: hypothetical protein VNZ48_10170 [Xanthobacteraceae bacterium]|jgi:hypothetical protein|nr:hypothetical protein [Xanthobacteraceae bacterium]